MVSQFRDKTNAFAHSFAYHLAGFSVPNRLLANAADSQSQKLMENAMVSLLGANAVHTHIDVGACHGAWSQDMARVFPRSTFLLIEPNPATFIELQRATRSMDRVINVAVSTTNHGQTQFFQTVDPKGSSILRPIETAKHAWLEVESVYTVQTRRLDSLLEEFEISQIGVLKVDTQGHDLSVLQSTGSFLRPESIPLVLTEVNFRDWYQDQESWWELVQLLDSRGYGVAQIHERRGDFGSGLVKWADILFASKETLRRL